MSERDEFLKGPCGDCGAKCCGPNVAIEFSKTEAGFIRSSGTRMVMMEGLPVEPDVKGNDFYLMNSQCGFVNKETGECRAYRDPQKPAICDRFKAGTKACRKIKHRPGFGSYVFGY
jgi:Fe-S-cluster containining protein